MADFARRLGFTAGLVALSLWVVLGIKYLANDPAIAADAWLVILLMSFLAIVGMAAALREKPLVMLGDSLVSFIPVGFYLLGVPSYFKLVGISNLLLLLSSLLMLSVRRKVGNEGAYKRSQE